MKAAYALHLISNPETQPGSVFEIDDKEFDRLKSKGAVREPSEDEMALYELAQKRKGAAPADDDAAAKVAAGKAEKTEKDALIKRLKEAGQKPHPKTGIEKLREAVAKLDDEGDEDLDLGGD